MHEELLGSTRQNYGIFPAWYLSIHRPSQRLRHTLVGEARQRCGQDRRAN
jgi:hypothetical protein